MNGKHSHILFIFPTGNTRLDRTGPSEVLSVQFASLFLKDHCFSPLPLGTGSLSHTHTHTHIHTTLVTNVVELEIDMPAAKGLFIDFHLAVDV